jgi:hypothetical protein
MLGAAPGRTAKNKRGHKEAEALSLAELACPRDDFAKESREPLARVGHQVLGNRAFGQQFRNLDELCGLLLRTGVARFEL